MAIEYLKAYIDDLLITLKDSFQDHFEKLEQVGEGTYGQV